MKTPDPLCEVYDELLDGHYDCVDRIVLNAYFPLAQSFGGLRCFWRDWHGSDDTLTTAHLMREAGHFARRVWAFAKKHHIPLLQCGREDRKHAIAEQHQPHDPNFRGVFCITVGRAPAPVREVKRYASGGLHIQLKEPMPWVNHYFFHILDPDAGHVTIRFCPHPPFNAQVIFNGHEWVERAALRQGVAFRKEQNCFTELADASALDRIAETMRADGAEGRLREVAERWLYSSCLAFVLPLAEQERLRFRYQYSVYQVEYSRNYLFRRGREMEQLFQALIDRTRVPLDLPTVKTIFGYKRRPHFRTERGKLPRCELVVEKPLYDLTVIKLHFGPWTLKIYSKGERVLRVEVILHNGRRLPGGYGLDKWGVIVGQLAALLERFVGVLRCVDRCWVDAAVLEDWPRRGSLDGRAVAGVDLNRARTRGVLEAVQALAVQPAGFPASELAARVRRHPEAGLPDYTPRQAAYDLRKLRAKRVVERPVGTLRYRVLPEGLRAATAVLVLRNKVLIPLLAHQGHRRRAPRAHLGPVERHHDNIQREMQGIFHELGLAA